MKNRCWRQLALRLCQGNPRTTVIAPKTQDRPYIRVRYQGLWQDLPVDLGSDFEGWGHFACRVDHFGATRVHLLGQADETQRCAFLNQLTSSEVRLSRKLDNNSWLAVPLQSVDGQWPGVVVHLVEALAPFTLVRVRSDGCQHWYDSLSRSDNPALADRLQAALLEGVLPNQLHLAGLTPSDRMAYTRKFWHQHPPGQAVAPEQSGAPAAQINREEQRLIQALGLGGGKLQNYLDRGSEWLVYWIDSAGNPHASLVRKTDLTILNSGICLSGQDRDFDLTSLVGVVEGAEPW